MKKTSILVLLIVIVISITSGTFAYYSLNLNDLGDGSSTAKNFVLTSSNTAQYSEDIEIAPTETNTHTFTISNFDGNVVTETNMDLNIQVQISASAGKSAIPYLTAVVKKDGKQVGVGQLTNGVGTITVDDFFLADNGPQTYTYTVEITWPDHGTSDSNNNKVSDDAEYSSGQFGNTITFTVIGTQCFHTSH